jgi:hypothetical protein
MTSGLPQTRPGAVTQPDQGLMERIRRLEEQVEELSRRDMNRATVGQGGTFRGYYDNGQLAFTFGEDVDDGVRKVRMNWPSTGDPAFQVGPGNPNANEDEQFKLVDQSGNKVFATDGLAGYGLAEPSLTYLMAPVDSFARTGCRIWPPSPTHSFITPVYGLRIRITNSAGGITGGTARLVAIDGNGVTQVASSSASFGTGISVLTRIILLPEVMINAQNCKLQWKITPTGSGSLQCWPLMCKGVSKSFYDIDVA